jgi:hypothetical protein
MMYKLYFKGRKEVEQPMLEFWKLHGALAGHAMQSRLHLHHDFDATFANHHAFMVPLTSARGANLFHVHSAHFIVLGDLYLTHTVEAMTL